MLSRALQPLVGYTCPRCHCVQWDRVTHTTTQGSRTCLAHGTQTVDFLRTGWTTQIGGRAWDTAGCAFPFDNAWGWDGQREFGGTVEYPILYHGTHRWDRHWGIRIIPSCPMVNEDRMDSWDWGHGIQCDTPLWYWAGGGGRWDSMACPIPSSTMLHRGTQSLRWTNAGNPRNKNN